MKSFSELTSASQVNNEDLLAISQTSGSGYASKKTTVKDIADKSNLNLAEEYDSTSTYAVDDYVIYESVLYKCIASTTGTFDSTKWTSVVVTDEMGSGGGGTGGHTIINENGTSMTARAGLQFTGNVVITDDATNNKTIVSIPSGGGHNYSTTEHIVGTWIDGSTIYEKTIYAPTGTFITVSDWTQISGFSNIGKMIDTKINVVKGTESRSVYQRSDNVDALPRFEAYNGGIYYFTNTNTFAFYNWDWYITFQYIKSS